MFYLPKLLQIISNKKTTFTGNYLLTNLFTTISVSYDASVIYFSLCRYDDCPFLQILCNSKNFSFTLSLVLQQIQIYIYTYLHDGFKLTLLGNFVSTD